MSSMPNLTNGSNHLIKERFKEDKAKYTTENLDHAKWSTRLDEELFVQFLDFYNTAIK